MFKNSTELFQFCQNYPKKLQSSEEISIWRHLCHDHDHDHDHDHVTMWPCDHWHCSRRGSWCLRSGRHLRTPGTRWIFSAPRIPSDGISEMAKLEDRISAYGTELSEAQNPQGDDRILRSQNPRWINRILIRGAECLVTKQKTQWGNCRIMPWILIYKIKRNLWNTTTAPADRRFWS